MDAAEFNPVPGQVAQLEPGIRRILAPNPSPMTFRGTNTYLLGHGAVAVIDPGPADPAHIQAILAALTPEEHVSHILLTHSHLDHSAGAPALARATGAPLVAFGDSTAGRDPEIATLKGLGGGEGIDSTFRPDICLADGEVLSGDRWQVEALWTPGHIGNHLCFAANGAVFSGDHVMGWATSMVSPPDGNLTAFMTSLRKLQGRGDRIYYPAHGAPVENPEARLAELLAHRRMRETQILEALQRQPGTATALTRRIYTEVPPALLPAAERNVIAHLIDLTRRNMVTPAGELSLSTEFSLV